MRISTADRLSPGGGGYLAPIGTRDKHASIDYRRAKQLETAPPGAVAGIAEKSGYFVGYCHRKKSFDMQIYTYFI